MNPNPPGPPYPPQGPAFPPPPPRPRQGDRVFKNVGIGCGAILAGLTLLIGCSALVADPDADKQAKPAKTVTVTATVTTTPEVTASPSAAPTPTTASSPTPKTGCRDGDDNDCDGVVFADDEDDEDPKVGRAKIRPPANGGGGGDDGGGGGGRVVHPGSFCSTSGATGVTKKGTPMVCRGGRWRAA